MEHINETDKNRLLQFINENELDYTAVDNGLFKFNLIAYDKQAFQFYTFESQHIIVKYDKNKDKPGTIPYEYYYFQNMQQVLEQLKLYDNSIPKTWWYPIIDTIDLGLDKFNYNENWFSEFLRDDNYLTEQVDDYCIITYQNDEYKPELYSPFNTLHEVSLFNNQTATKLDKLLFEIHPISCLEGAESYLVKLAFNDDLVLKEWINYRIIRKKGLKLFLESLFNDMKKFKTI